MPNSAEITQRSLANHPELWFWLARGLLVSCAVVVLASDTHLLTCDLWLTRRAEPVLDLRPCGIVNKHVAPPLQPPHTAGTHNCAYVNKTRDAQKMDAAKPYVCVFARVTVNSEEGNGDVWRVCSLRLQMFTPGGLTLITFHFLQAL